jgi:hypothetical protein
MGFVKVGEYATALIASPMRREVTIKQGQSGVNE